MSLMTIGITEDYDCHNDEREVLPDDSQVPEKVARPDEETHPRNAA
jgi:hypothetical protein